MRQSQGDIELAGLCKSFDGITNVVDGVNLKIPDGAYCCFLGPSGCGKTTILRMIAGHEDPTAGEIVIGGENVVGLAPVERRTAMMFQSYALFPHLSVRDNIAFALRVRGQVWTIRIDATPPQAGNVDVKNAQSVRAGRAAAPALARTCFSGIDDGDGLDLDHEIGSGETGNADGRAGRGRHPEIAHADVGALLELVKVGDKGVGLDDIGPGGAALRHRSRFWNVCSICARMSPLPTQLPSMSRANWPAV